TSTSTCGPTRPADLHPHLGRAIKGPHWRSVTVAGLGCSHVGALSPNPLHRVKGWVCSAAWDTATKWVELGSFEKLARELSSRLNGVNDVFPPGGVIIDAIAPCLTVMQAELEAFTAAVDDHTPRQMLSVDDVQPIVTPDSLEYWMALSDGNGLYIQTSRPRGRRLDQPNRDEAFSPTGGGDISVAVYVDGADYPQIERLFHHVDDLVQAPGYDGPTDGEVQSGSWFRQSTAKAKAKPSHRIHLRSA
ncbi:hypothetical protein, partial [Flexivirga endophytica]